MAFPTPDDGTGGGSQFACRVGRGGRMAGTVVAGLGVLFAWNRVPGDNGSNTLYRLFVQGPVAPSDGSGRPPNEQLLFGLLQGGGGSVRRSGGLEPWSTEPGHGFVAGIQVAGPSATAPTMVSPAHNSTVSSGNIQLGWSPVPGATLYEY